MSRKKDINKIFSNFEFDYNNDFDDIKKELHISNNNQPRKTHSFKYAYSILMTVLVIALSIVVINMNGKNEMNQKYNLEVIDNFNYIIDPLQETYVAGEEVTVTLKTTLPEINGIRLNNVDYYSEYDNSKNQSIVKFNMPNKDSKLYTISNEYIDKACNNENHEWIEEDDLYEIKSLGITEKCFICSKCGEKKSVPFELNSYNPTVLVESINVKIDDNTKNEFKVIKSMAEANSFIENINKYNDKKIEYPSYINDEYFQEYYLYINYQSAQDPYRENTYYKVNEDNSLELYLIKDYPYSYLLFSFDFDEYQLGIKPTLVSIVKVKKEILDSTDNIFVKTIINNLSIEILDVHPIIGFIPKSIFQINTNNFICDNKISFTSNIIRSVEELNIFKQYFDIPDEAYTEYDEEYFKTNSLVVFKDIIKKQLYQYDMDIVNFEISNGKIYFYYKKSVKYNLSNSDVSEENIYLYKLIEVPNNTLQEKENVEFVEIVSLFD